MVRFLSLSSGSNGNCYYFGDDKTAFLIDIGIGARTIKKRLAEHDISIDSVDAIFVTHDHFDHINTSVECFENLVITPNAIQIMIYLT